MPIYHGQNRIDHIMVGRGPNATAIERVYLGHEVVYQKYREQFWWFDADTAGRRVSDDGTRWVWDFERPQWASEFDMVAVRTGGTGQDGSRGIGNNDGSGGRAWSQYVYSSSLPVEHFWCQVHIGIPGTTGPEQADRSPHPSVLWRQTGPGAGTASPPGGHNVGGISPSDSMGASVAAFIEFGRSFPGGAGGARDQPGQGYGGAGGGGGGGPVFGSPSPKPGQMGAPGFVAVRFRTGPAPSGHVWPENPDWASPH